MSDLQGRGAVEALKLALEGTKLLANANSQFHKLIDLKLDQLPLPAAGSTLTRWRALAEVAGQNLSLAKMYEGHTDALAILAELGDQNVPGSTWGVWAAEAANVRVIITPAKDGTVLLDGLKPWCSGAQIVNHGLLTAWYADGRGPQLVRVHMNQNGVQVTSAAWQAIGMAESASVDVRFSQANADLVGQVGSYLSRPGFWQGGAGIAACWYGGSLTLATTLQQALALTPSEARGPFRLAALGKIDLALSSTAAVLQQAARWIDDNPLADACTVALRARLAAESCAGLVLDEAGRALGANAFCRDRHFARTAADLPVFVRQSHAERDFSALAERVVNLENEWHL
jgi:alkylation response protein AidB-like acyl-CoA dehydrogenase